MRQLTPTIALDLAGLDEGHHHRRSLRHQHGVTQFLGFALQILDGAEPTTTAEQAELIDGGLAFVFDPKALREEEQALGIGNRRQRLPPHLVVDQYARVFAVEGVRLEAFDHSVGVLAQLLQWQRRDRVEFGHIMTNELEQSVALRRCWGDLLAGGPKALLDHVRRNPQSDGAGGKRGRGHSFKLGLNRTAPCR